MSLISRLNQLDDRTGAARVGEGLRLYGIYFAWPFMVRFGLILGTASVVRGRLVQGLILYGFAFVAGLLIFFARRASVAYRAMRQPTSDRAINDEPPVFDVR